MQLTIVVCVIKSNRATFQPKMDPGSSVSFGILIAKNLIF
ncbi:MAG: hypothetical protein PWQ55_872 [Chloroflexota bacterium]|nr:hypothetical protein [Chloroflexota bacterium]